MTSPGHLTLAWPPIGPAEAPAAPDWLAVAAMTPGSGSAAACPCPPRPQGAPAVSGGLWPGQQCAVCNITRGYSDDTATLRDMVTQV